NIYSYFLFDVSFPFSHLHSFPTRRSSDLAVFYGRCAYGESDDLYEKLYEFIKENNLRICSDAYEEYPLNELSTKDENQYCVKIRSEEHTSELQSRFDLVCRLLLEKKKVII